MRRRPTVFSGTKKWMKAEARSREGLKAGRCATSDKSLDEKTKGQTAVTDPCRFMG